jgi:hypothetical protein
MSALNIRNLQKYFLIVIFFHFYSINLVYATRQGET